jgi:hypothetical protein
LTRTTHSLCAYIEAIFTAWEKLHGPKARLKSGMSNVCRSWQTFCIILKQPDV